jgi:drug/metabolite transporter (DMT)-like permease
MVFWSMSFIWTKQLLVFIPPLSLILVRLIISTVFLAAIGFFNKKLNKIPKDQIWSLIGVGIFNPFLYFIGENMAMQTLSPTVVAVLIGTIPVFTPLAAYLLVKERIGFTNYLGILLSVVGAGLVVILPNMLNTISVKGILFAVLAIFSAVAYTMSVRKVSKEFNALSITLYQNIIGIVLFLPVHLLIEPQGFQHITLTSELLVPLLSVSILCSSLAFVFYNHGIKYIGASLSTSFTNLIPVLTAIFSYFILNELLNILQQVGIFVTVLGLFIAQGTIMKPSKNKLYAN